MNISRISIVLLLAISVLFNAFTFQRPTAQAQSTLESRVQALEDQVTILIARIDALEGTAPPMTTPVRSTTSVSTPSGPTASQNGNMRDGPGTQYAVVGSVSAGQALSINGYSTGSRYTWYRLASGGWLADLLVQNPPTDAPKVSIPTPIATSAPTSTPIRPSTPTAQPPSVCSCSGNVYNCSDFSTQSQAQGCFAYCQQSGAGDIHGLDRDNDNLACESLP